MGLPAEMNGTDGQNAQSSRAADGAADALITAGRTERGAPVLFVLGSGITDRPALGRCFERLLDRYRIVAPIKPLPHVEHVPEYTADLARALDDAGVKRLTLIGVSGGGSVAQALAVELPGIVRRVLLVDPTARITPSLSTRIIDRVERFLPTGLPLRSLTAAFDSRPLLHRLRCPVLVLVSPSAGLFEQSQARLIARRAPNARLRHLTEALYDDEGHVSGELAGMLEEFNLTPAKRSQKPLSEGGQAAE